jgi:hypothetical protein
LPSSASAGAPGANKKESPHHEAPHLPALIHFPLNSLLWFRPRPAYACFSPFIDSPAEAFTQADAIFTGRVTAINRPPKLSFITPGLLRFLLDVQAYSIYNNIHNHRVTFTITQSWKGIVTTEAIIIADNVYNPFGVGKEYLVYAHRVDNTWVAGQCVMPLESADPAFVPTLPTLPLITPFPWHTFCSILPILAILLLATILWRTRRRKQPTPAA